MIIVRGMFNRSGIPSEGSPFNDYTRLGKRPEKADVTYTTRCIRPASGLADPMIRQQQVRVRYTAQFTAKKHIHWGRMAVLLPIFVVVRSLRSQVFWPTIHNPRSLLPRMCDRRGSW